MLEHAKSYLTGVAIIGAVIAVIVAFVMVAGEKVAIIGAMVLGFSVAAYCMGDATRELMGWKPLGFYGDADAKRKADASAFSRWRSKL